MKQSQKRYFSNAGCDCRQCTGAASYWSWVATILVLAAVTAISIGVVAVFKH